MSLCIDGYSLHHRGRVYSRLTSGYSVMGVLRATETARGCPGGVFPYALCLEDQNSTYVRMLTSWTPWSRVVGHGGYRLPVPRGV